MRCAYCGEKTKHAPIFCPKQKEVNEKSVEELLALGYRWLEGGGLCHPDFFKKG